MKPITITFQDQLSVGLALQAFAVLAAKAQDMHNQLAQLAVEASKPEEPQPEPGKEAE